MRLEASEVEGRAGKVDAVLVVGVVVASVLVEGAVLATVLVMGVVVASVLVVPMYFMNKAGTIKKVIN